MSKIDDFIRSLQKDTYPEPPSQIHGYLTRAAIDSVATLLPDGASVLDIGCGQGYALDEFRSRGIHCVGITTNLEDIHACRLSEHNVVAMDMHTLGFKDSHFDLVFARHVLEHSPIPYFVIRECWRILKPDGLFYVECPAPETDCLHETNRNHYSVLTYGMWVSLLSRSGFKMEITKRIDVPTAAGPDIYHSFLCRKLNSFTPGHLEPDTVGEPATQS